MLPPHLRISPQCHQKLQQELPSRDVKTARTSGYSRAKSTKRNVLSKVRGQKLDGVISENRFAQKLDWDRKSMCVYHPKRTNMFSSENLRFENFDDRLEMIRSTSTWLQTTGSVRARPRGANLVFVVGVVSTDIKSHNNV